MTFIMCVENVCKKSDVSSQDLKAKLFQFLKPSHVTFDICYENLTLDSSSDDIFSLEE